ncbi:MAG TPA: GWxTD domain-containing protein [Candidatus Acidoferrum sp.]|nr:GWxTD domain-containing protein [Candidatus Acidoferrum sp.]
MPSHSLRHVTFAFSALFAFGPVVPAQDAPAKNPPKEPSQKEQTKQRKKARKELTFDFTEFIQEDAKYIILKEELDAFKRLSTNEEREAFIEIFWQRRNPNPDSTVNEFREEHYRRIAYANEHFASGIPGWKTDRGHIYIVWGPPDEIDSHPTGGTYDRPAYEGGGSTTTYPWEIWRYRHMETVGENVELEFVDTTGTGEYRLTRDPGEKDALAHVPGAGPSALEAMGLKSKVDRFTNTDGTTLPAPLGPRPASMNEFESLGRYYRVLGPPPPIQDLHPGVFSRVIRNQINLAYDLAFLRATADSTIVPITLQIPNNQMGFRSKDGIHSAILNVYARITTPGGRLVQSFEEAIGHDVPDSLFEKDLSRSLLFQKSLPLHPGLYRLDVVVKDVESGNVGLIGTALRVPQYEEGVLNASSLILADKIEPVPSREFGLGQFVLGAYKVRPRLAHTFSNAENLGIFLQLYNLKTDEILDATSVAVTYRLLRDKQQIWSSVESSGSIRRDGEQITLNRRLPLAAFAPGHYRLEIKVQDNFSHQIVTRTADFEIALPSSSR